MNNTSIIGRLTREPETKILKNGTQVTNFAIANEIGFGDKKWVNYFECTAFGHSAKFIGQYIHKGDRIGVDGHLKQERWQDKTTGQQRSKIVVIVSNVEGLTCKQQPANNYPQQQPANNYQQQNQQQQNQQVVNDPWANNEPIPF